MDGLYRNTLINRPLSEWFYLLSRLCVYMYGLVYFLNIVLSIPTKYNTILQMGIIISGIIGVVLEKGINIGISKFFIWYFLILFISIFSSLYTLSDTYQSNINNILQILLVGVSFSPAVRSEKNIHKFLLGETICGVLMFLILFSKNLLYVDDRLGRTLTAGNLNQFALYIMLLAFASIACFYMEKKLHFKIFFLIVVVLNVYMLMLSGGRKYILTPAIAIAIILLFKTANKAAFLKRLGIIAAIAVSFFIAWYLMMNDATLYASIGYRFAGNVATEDRADMIKYGLQFFFDNPLIGYGEKSFSELIYPFLMWKVYSHNNFIELMVNFGLVGLILYYSFYVNNIYCLYKKLKTAENNKLIIFFIAFMISGLFLHTGIVAYSSSSILFVFYVVSFNVCKLNFDKFPDKDKTTLIKVDK